LFNMLLLLLVVLLLSSKDIILELSSFNSLVYTLNLCSFVKKTTNSHLFLYHCCSFSILFLYAFELLYSIKLLASLIFLEIS